MERAGARRLAVKDLNSYTRACLTRSAGGLEQHLGKVIDNKRRKEIERSLRRLREQGELTFERASDPATVRQRVEEFLEMEHAGWKGVAGTAFLNRAADAEFARAAFGGTQDGDGLAVSDTLLLDGRPIAISLNIVSDRVLFTPKCTYDESFKKYGPGLCLEYLVVQRFYADRFESMDAATTVSGHVIQGLWNTDVTMGTLIVGKPVLVSATFAVLRKTAQIRKAAKQTVKSSPLLQRLVHRFKMRGSGDAHS